MPRNRHAIYVFRFLAMFVTLFGVAFLVRIKSHHALTWKDLTAFVVLIVLSVIGGGYVSLMYVQALRWLLQHLHVSENQKWVIAFGTTAICDVFLATHNMHATAALSFIALIMICVVAIGWGRDRSGMTEGFFVGFGKLLLINLFSGNLPSALFTGIVLFLAVVAKLTECADEATSAARLVGNADSPCPNEA
uniref:Pollen S n=1 Tax=Papaver rhoeas TaxID=33128 RepID=C5J8E4_PAPRH|nr:pollen S [Papaver rhoeas]